MSEKGLQQIGTMELLQLRIYPLDWNKREDFSATEVVVQPGEYPVMSDGFTYLVMLSGHINSGRMHRMGDGMFSVRQSDVESEIPATFPSLISGPDEFKELLLSPVATEGPDQRLRFRITEVADA